MEEMRRRLSWVDFLAPLSEEEMDALVRRASFVRLDAGEVPVVGPEEQVERMLLLVEGQLQVYEVALSSGREHTLSVLTTGRWLRPRASCAAGRESCTSGRWRLRWYAA